MRYVTRNACHDGPEAIMDDPRLAPLDPDWVGAMPTSFFVDRSGKVVKGHAGRMLYRDLEREVLKLLEEAAPDAAATSSAQKPGPGSR